MSSGERPKQLEIVPGTEVDRRSLEDAIRKQGGVGDDGGTDVE
ncbi:hypothetical protein [Natronococcus roseus]